MVKVVPLRRPVRLAALRCDDCGSDQVIVIGLPPDEAVPLVPRCLYCAMRHWPFTPLEETPWKPGSARPAAR